ncbi:hypothetical protein ACFJIV_24145 [Mucilaginibacter sp. UC70_90]
MGVACGRAIRSYCTGLNHIGRYPLLSLNAALRTIAKKYLYVRKGRPLFFNELNMTHF